MKVILLKDVKKVGKKDQTVEVNDGYANNYLLPNRLAVPLSKKSSEILANQKENDRIAEENAVKEAKELSLKLKDYPLEFKMKVGQNGKTFGSISLKQIEDEMKNKYNVEIDKRKFIDKGNLDSLGYYKLRIELYKGVVGEIKVHIVERKN